MTTMGATTEIAMTVMARRRMEVVRVVMATTPTMPVGVRTRGIGG